MAQGFGGLKEQLLDPIARGIAERGFVVLLHDHRDLGTSTGTPRGDVNPWQQIADWRRVISYLESLDDVDSDRIGIWGTSYAGGRAALEREFDADERAQLAGEPPAPRALVSDDPAMPAFYRDPHAVSTYLSPLPAA